MDTPKAPMQPPIPVPGTPAAPKAADAPPPEPKQPDVATPPTPPAATAPPVPGDAPKPAPEPGTPATEPPGDAAPPAAPPVTPQAEITDLKEPLTRLVSDPRFVPVPEPQKTGGFSDDRVTSLFKTYSEIPQDKEGEAFGLVLKSAVDIAREEIAADQQRERVQQQNAGRAARLVKAVYEQITEKVQAQAPDVDIKDFWEYAAPKAERETPAHLTNPIDRWEWQTKRAVAIYREKFGSQKPPAPVPQAADDPNAIRRPATAVIPGGSLQPRGSTPSGRPRSMVDQMGAIQERILPGPNRR